MTKVAGNGRIPAAARQEKGGSGFSQAALVIIEMGCGGGRLTIVSLKSGGRRRLRRVENGEVDLRFRPRCIFLR
jgi:hypothetical protein